MAEEINSAQKATEIAVTFIKKYRSYARPLKAIREDSTWLVEINVGIVFTSIAKIKIDAKTGDIIEYSTPA